MKREEPEGYRLGDRPLWEFGVCEVFDEHGVFLHTVKAPDDLPAIAPMTVIVVNP